MDRKRMEDQLIHNEQEQSSVVVSEETELPRQEDDASCSQRDSHIQEKLNKQPESISATKHVLYLDSRFNSTTSKYSSRQEGEDSGGSSVQDPQQTYDPEKRKEKKVTFEMEEGIETKINKNLFTELNKNRPIFLNRGTEEKETPISVRQLQR